MRRVTGIGGIFFKAKDPKALCEWYHRHLGIDSGEWAYFAFPWADAEGKPVAGMTVWSVKDSKSQQFEPGTAPFMVNYRVEDLAGLLSALRSEGCQVLDKVDDTEYGKFGWVVDPEGNKIELWEPPP